MAQVIIREHSGKEHVTDVENYNPAEVFRQMQSAFGGGMNMILIGSVMVDVRSINSISLATDPEPAAEPESPAEEVPTDSE